MGSLPNPRIKRSKWSYFRSFSEGHPGGNLWDIWGKLVNDWASAKKKPAFIKVSLNIGVDNDGIKKFDKALMSCL